MKKISIIVEQEHNVITGGQKYDKFFIEQIRKVNDNVFVLTDKKIKYSNKIPSILYNIFYLFYFKKLIKSDIIIVNSRLYPRLFFFLLILNIFRKKSKKTFAFHHHYNFMVHTGIKSKAHKFFELSFLKMMSSLIIPSKYILNITRDILPKTKTEFIEIAFDKKENKSTPRHIKNLVFVGKIEKRKGLHLLIESLQFVKSKVKVDLIGSFNPEDKYYLSLIEQIKKSNLIHTIIFHGRLDEEKMKTVLKASSVFVFPTLHEGYGMVMMEAMSYGLPVIAFDNSSIPFVIKDNYNGIIVQNKNTTELANKIENIINDRILFQRLSINSKETYNNCRKSDDIIQDIDNFCKKYFK
ncbi:glycosyltransferase family 4 protein [Cellulophaga baltica]|uniref:glycosyltransferase family 4 protein n=1 Tax=Cellulophaga baltica TaxID=76594 RepID=UPI0015F67974|nr:glycosyltransferase family 4 protein [Cellulophaga baltica]MBA6313760.1 glycosyltransferase family 4 protein [Cellulophaga baltica]MCR1023264.1 glycosyltransferase family 4 protein [Cellulophaga baltica]